MKLGTPGFRPERLVEARDSRGLTQVALAEIIGLKSSAVSRWEAGETTPEPDALQALANAVRLPVSFFLRAPAQHGERPMFFRTLASTTQGERRRARVRLGWAEDISANLQEWVDLPDVDVPCCPAENHRDIRNEDIEEFALECRRRWRLGLGPLTDVLLILENAGIVVVREELGTAKMDGVSHWSDFDNRPYMLIASDKATAVRSRMDAAHELAHLVLHRHISARTLNNAADFKEIERQAFCFAGAFLMPGETFAAEVASPSLNTFLALKDRWKVSIGAMISRCSNLGMIENEYEQRVWKHYSARGWRRGEPLDDELPIETPRLLARSVKLLIDEGVRTRDDIVSDFRLDPVDIEAICGLPRGYLTSPVANIIKFPSIRTKTSEPSWSE